MKMCMVVVALAGFRPLSGNKGNQHRIAFDEPMECEASVPSRGIRVINLLCLFHYS